MLSTCLLFTELFQSMHDVFSTDIFTILLFNIFSVLLLFAYSLVFVVTFFFICPSLIQILKYFLLSTIILNLILLFPIFCKGFAAGFKLGIILENLYYLLWSSFELYFSLYYLLQNFDVCNSFNFFQYFYIYSFSCKHCLYLFSISMFWEIWISFLVLSCQVDEYFLFNCSFWHHIIYAPKIRAA